MPYAEQRTLQAYNRRARICGIGEIESVTQDKMKALAQAGIYGVGQLITEADDLYKDKSAQVAVVTTHLPSIPMNFSLGDVKYQLVGRLDSLSLKEETELQEFAKLVVSTIRWVASMNKK